MSTLLSSPQDLSAWPGALSADQSHGQVDHSQAQVEAHLSKPSDDPSVVPPVNISATVLQNTKQQTTHSVKVAQPTTIGKEGLNVHQRDPASSEWFDRVSMKHLQKSLYYASSMRLPAEAKRTWESNIKPQLKTDVRNLVASCSPKPANKPLAYLSFGMVGSKERDQLVHITPMIMVFCSSKKTSNQIDKQFKRLKLHYLEDSEFPLVVLHVKLLNFSASPSTDELPMEGAPTPGELRAVWLEQRDSLRGCGPKLKWDVLEDGKTRQIYSTLGGCVQTEESLWALSAAHPFLTCDVVADDESLTEPDSDDEIDPHENEENNSGRHSDEQRKVVPVRNHYSPPEETSFNLLWQPEKVADIAYSFMGQVRRPDSNITDGQAGSDWVLLKMPDADESSATRSLSTLDSGYESLSGASIIAEGQTDLDLGKVYITAKPDRLWQGFMTEASVVLYTGASTMTVREIMLDCPLPPASSGCWVFRGFKAVGMVVVESGNSCFILTMEDIIKSIAQVFGGKVELILVADVNLISSTWKKNSETGLSVSDDNLVSGDSDPNIPKEGKSLERSNNPSKLQRGQRHPPRSRPQPSSPGQGWLESAIVRRASHFFSRTRIQPTAKSGHGKDDEDEWKVDMEIVLPGDPVSAHFSAMIDSGSDFNLISYKNMEKLKIPYDQKITTPIAFFAKRTFMLLGNVDITWTDGFKAKPYTTRFYVLPADLDVNFDFLLGSDWLRIASRPLESHESSLSDKFVSS